MKMGLFPYFLWPFSKFSINYYLLRYEFKKEGKKAALLELGPRMTLRLKWLLKGTYDTRAGEYEFYLKVIYSLKNITQRFSPHVLIQP